MPRCSRLCAQPLSHVWLFATPRTAARQAPLSMGFSRQEHWSGLPLPSPGDLANSGIEQVPSCLLFCSIPVHDSMIFFRGPWVYISPTRIPARCPAKEVLGEKENLHECLLCCRIHSLLNSQGRVSESQFADSSSASHLSCWAAFNSVSRTSLPTLQEKKKSTMNNKHNRFKRQSPSLTKRSERSPSGQQKCFCQSNPLYIFQLYVCSSYQEVSMKCISPELNLELVTATVRVRRYLCSLQSRQLQFSHPD